MPRRDYDDFDDETDPDDPGPSLSDREAPDASDMDEDDDPATVPCPYCRTPVSEDAEICPRCGSFISQEDAPRRPHPWWVWAGVILCLIAMLWWAF